MFFTWIGLVGAWLAFIFGALRIAIAVHVISRDDAEAVAFYAARYFGEKTPGQVIDQSFMVITFAIALGTLAEMSRTICRRGERSE
jgi:hypothetical protein